MHYCLILFRAYSDLRKVAAIRPAFCEKLRIDSRQVKWLQRFLKCFSMAISKGFPDNSRRSPKAGHLPSTARDYTDRSHRKRNT